MTHCVYYAIEEHLRYLEIEPIRDDWLIYQGCRVMADNQGYTFGGIVPFISQMIAKRHNLYCFVYWQSWFNQKFWLDQANENEKILVNLAIWYGHYVPNVAGIYLPLRGSHAIFSTSKPKEKILMCIRLRRK